MTDAERLYYRLGVASALSATRASEDECQDDQDHIFRRLEDQALLIMGELEKLGHGTPSFEEAEDLFRIWHGNLDQGGRRMNPDHKVEVYVEELARLCALEAKIAVAHESGRSPEASIQKREHLLLDMLGLTGNDMALLVEFDEMCVSEGDAWAPRFCRRCGSKERLDEKETYCRPDTYHDYPQD